MKRLILVASIVLFAGNAFAQVTERDIVLRQRAQELMQRCNNGTAAYCMGIGDGFYRGWMEENGKRMNVPQSEPLSADFYSIACSKGIGKACGFAADTYMRLRDPSIPEQSVFAIAQKGCALDHNPSCRLAGEMSSKGIGTKVNELTALSYYTKACELGNESGCTLQKMTENIVELSHKKEEIDKSLRDLERANKILSDPDLNK
ncbi:hypothetical protein N9L47_01010 [Rhodobacteraceae bacterium]|nr:hypothetical protein [Paracoccaceae bacterium]